MKKKVYIDELETTGDKILKFSKVNIHDKINELKQMPENFIWDGPGYQNYMFQYNRKMKKLEKINDNLNIIATYLTTAKENYEEANFNINKLYEELLEDEEKKNEL